MDLIGSRPFNNTSCVCKGDATEEDSDTPHGNMCVRRNPYCAQREPQRKSRAWSYSVVELVTIGSVPAELVGGKRSCPSLLRDVEQNVPRDQTHGVATERTRSTLRPCDCRTHLHWREDWGRGSGRDNVECVLPKGLHIISAPSLRTQRHVLHRLRVPL